MIRVKKTLAILLAIMFVVSLTAAAASARADGHNKDKGKHWQNGHFKKNQGTHYEKDYTAGYKDGIKDGYEGNDLDFNKNTRGYIDGYKDGYNDGKALASDDNGDKDKGDKGKGDKGKGKK
jgi:hypothetical protein